MLTNFNNYYFIQIHLFCQQIDIMADKNEAIVKENEGENEGDNNKGNKIFS